MSRFVSVFAMAPGIALSDFLDSRVLGTVVLSIALAGLVAIGGRRALRTYSSAPLQRTRSGSDSTENVHVGASSAIQEDFTGTNAAGSIGHVVWESIDGRFRSKA